MKLAKIGDKLEKEVGFPGVYTGKVRWDLSQPKLEASYIGPDIPPEEWRKILSFFAWTYDTTHSESQVRLYVNPDLGTWKGWAWPQEARTGMSSKELDVPLPPDQTALFNADNGWLYFGTVHHHCSGTAFQSSVDLADERRIEGLHITVGKMGQEHYDIHARFSLSGEMLIPNMAHFWDIGEGILASVPKEMHDTVARFQMGIPSTVDFPAEWKANYQEVKRVPFESGGRVVVGGNGFVYTRHNYNKNTDSWACPENKRIEFAADTLIDLAHARKWKLEELAEFLNNLTKPSERAILETLKDFKVDPWQVSSEMNWLAKRNFTRPTSEPKTESKDQAYLDELRAKHEASHEAHEAAKAKQKATDDGMSEEEKDAWSQAMQEGGY